MKKLKLLLLPLLFSLLLGIRTAPVHAGVVDLYEDIACVADINCTIEAAGAAGVNFVFRTAVGEDAHKLTAEDVNQMVSGRWNKGMASMVGDVGSLAYSTTPTGDHFADIVKNSLSNNILNSRAAAAEDVGKVILNPIELFWKATRNVAYGLFAIVMVAIGFMIILQKEISPRVVLTFTNALPRILGGLVLITFSLPLIALIFDIFAVFASSLVASVAVKEVLRNITSNLDINGAAGIIGGLPTLFAGFVIDAVAGLVTGGLVKTVTMTIMVVGGIIIFTLALFRLLSSYAWILVYTIFSPIIILFGSLPGQEGSITDLGKKLVAKTLVFPVILFFFILALFFVAYTYNPATITLLTGGNIEEVVGRTYFFGTIMGPLMTLFMLAAAYKAPSLLEEGLGLNKPRGKK